MVSSPTLTVSGWEKHGPARCRSWIVLLSVLFPVCTGEIRAQSCLGSPARSVQLTLGIEGAWTPRAHSLGVAGRANLPGPPSVGFHAGAVDVEGAGGRLSTVGVQLALGAGGLGLGVCPVMGLIYEEWPEDPAGSGAPHSLRSVPVGLGVGWRLGAGPVALIPSAQGGILHRRARGDPPPVSNPLTGGESGFTPYLEGGGTVLLGRTWFRIEVSRRFGAGSDRVTRVGLGFLF